MDPVYYQVVPGESGFLAVLDETGRIISEGQDLRSNHEATKFAQDHGKERGLVVSIAAHSQADPGRFPLNLSVSEETIRILGEVSNLLGMPRQDVISKGIMLMKVAAEANRDGKAFGIASSPDSLEIEIVGLGPISR